MWLEKKRKAGMNCPKIVAYRVKIVKYLVRIIFIPLDAFIICKMNEKPGKMYQKCLITYSVAVFCGSSRISPILQDLKSCPFWSSYKFSCSVFWQVQDFTYNQRFILSFTVAFFRMVHKIKTYRWSSVKYRTFSEGPN